MTGADANNMYKLENLMSNADVPCTVVWDESIVHYRAGAQLKGSKHTRWQIVRVGYNLRFPPDDLFLGVHGGIALDRSGDSNGHPGQEEILLKTLMNLAGGTYAPEEDLIRLIPAKATGSGYLYDGSAMLGACMLSKTRLKDDFLAGQFENGDNGMLFKYDAVYTLDETINPSTRVIDPVIVPENPKIANGYSNSPTAGTGSWKTGGAPTTTPTSSMYSPPSDKRVAARPSTPRPPNTLTSAHGSGPPFRPPCLA
jgi:hypothetical protein